MESTSLAMKIHISETTKKFLPDNYKVSERGEINVKGKGNMKTYWLECRENREPLHKAVEKETPTTNVIQPSTNFNRRMSMPTTTTTTTLGHQFNKIDSIIEERRIYSPVTFEDVAKRSVINSPAKSIKSAKTRASRSSSIGNAYNCPSEVFGDLVNDTEEFLEDLQRRNSVYSPISSPSFSPFMKKESKKNNVVVDMSKPSPSAPPDKSSTNQQQQRDGKIRKAIKFTEELESQKKALQNLDQMVKEIYENELPGMCYMNQMSNSRSEGFIHNICRWLYLFSVIKFANFF